MHLLFVITIFIAAFLLFAIQSMAAKMILPTLGGAPAVWNSVMLFFQGLLLAGYGYSHWLTGRSTRIQLLVHGAVAAASLLMLPIAMPENSAPLASAAPAVSALVVLVLAVGAPAFVLCTTSPLVSRWFADSGSPRAGRPYFLYAASNAGSMIALLAYPFVFEPSLSLTNQRLAWSITFGALVVLILACGLVALRSTGSIGADAQERERTPAPPPLTAGRALTRQRLLWIALALVPAGLSMAVTQHLATDIASVPFLWILPLSIYLLTYIIAFSGIVALAAPIAGFLFPLAATGVGAMLLVSARTPLALVVFANLALLLTAGIVCHARLAADKPHPSRLTEYYLLMAFGGVLAGLFSTLWAPNLFNSIVEYPILIVAACLLRTRTSPVVPRRPQPPRRLGLEVLGWIPVPLVLAAFYTFEDGWLGADELGLWTRYVLLVAVPLLLTLSVAMFRLRFAAAIALMTAIPFIHERPGQETILTIRTFFGVHRVIRTRVGGNMVHELYHGRTLHGMQFLEPALRRIPTSYYARESPIERALAMMGRRSDFARMGIVGLGAGTLAAYGREGLSITYFEIDPEVAAIAGTSGLFSFISDSPSPTDVVLGDARLTLAQRPPGEFDLLCLDAFSSDAIPVHLITREALAIYLRALNDRGVIVWHISNLFLDLEPVVADLAHDAGLVALSRNETATWEQEAQGRTASNTVVLARSWECIEPLRSVEGWRPLRRRTGMRLWTDDYCDLLSVLRWRDSE